MMKRRKLVITFIIILLLIIGVFSLLMGNRSIIFSYSFLNGKVSEYNRQMARNLYADYNSIISKIYVAEAYRSLNCIRWVFVSDNVLSEHEEVVILERLYAHMQVPRKNQHITVWEVFFCCDKVANSAWETLFHCNKEVNSAYVSRYGDDQHIGYNDVYSEWEFVPDIKNVLSFEVLTKIMLKNGIIYPMFGLSSYRIEELIPNIPKFSAKTWFH